MNNERKVTIADLIGLARLLGPDGNGLAHDGSPEANPEYKRGIVNLICDASGLGSDGYEMVDALVTEHTNDPPTEVPSNQLRSDLARAEDRIKELEAEKTELGYWYSLAPALRECIGCGQGKGRPHKEWCPVLTGTLRSCPKAR